MDNLAKININNALYKFGGYKTTHQKDYHKLPSEQLLYDALNQNKITLIDNLIIIPSSNIKESILFSADYWSNKMITYSGETVRAVNFKGLNDQLKFEVKILGVCILWLFNKNSKLPSLIRNIENIVKIARTCQSLGIKSIYDLNRAPILEKFRAEFEKSDIRSAATIRNYYMSLNSATNINHTKLAELGFELRIGLSDLLPERKSNQVYCMPFDILASIWKSFMDYFDNISIDINSLRRIALINKEFINKSNIKILIRHSKINRICEKFESYCIFHESDLEYIYNLGAPFRDNIIVKRSDKDIEHLRQRDNFINSENKQVNIIREYAKYRINKLEWTNYYNTIVITARAAIQSMTGMRISEAKTITFGSLIEEDNYVGVKAILSKFASENGEDQDWAAAPYIVKIFNKITMIAEAFFDIPKEELNNYPICLNAKKFAASGKLEIMLHQRQSEFFANWSKTHNILISKENLKDFYSLNPNIENPKAIESEIFEDAFWPIKTHQFRRSIAVHSRRLGLIEMSDLSWQYKHLTRTMTEWYGIGGIENSIHNKAIPEAMAKELAEIDIKIAATNAIKFQEGSNLYGKGGQLLASQKGKHDLEKVYPSLKKAITMARRNKSKLMSLGNGLFCLNGQNCSMATIVQSAKCNPNCENLVADKDSIPIWIKRYNHYKQQLNTALDSKQSDATCDYFRLEMDYYKDALEYYGVIL